MERPAKTSRALLLPLWALLGMTVVVPLAVLTLISFAPRGTYGGVGAIGDLGAYLRSGTFLAQYRESLHLVYLRIGWRSLWLAAATTLACFAAGAPVAYAIALRVPPRARAGLLALTVIPFWTSFLVRVYAWMFLLRSEGLINHALLATGLIQQPLPLLYSDLAVFLGLLYGELPFMILPIYAALEKLDRTLLEAAADLGANGRSVLTRIVLPLSLPGIAAGALLVFIPSLGQFVVSDLLGGARSMLLGNLVQNQFAIARNQPFGAAVALELTAAVLLVLFAVSLLTRRRSMRELLE